MEQIQSVCGPVSPDALGHCQIHEHIFLRPTPMAERNPALRFDDLRRSLEELERYRAAGGTSLADAQPVAAGRDSAALERLSRESGVAVIASTGYHLLGFYRPDCWVHRLDGEGLYKLYRSELEDGLLPWEPDPAWRPERVLPIRAGLVKAAIPAQGPAGRYEVLLRAASRAAADTGVPLMLHTERGERALEALAICFDAGMRPEKIVVCHADRQAGDWSVHDGIASAGVYLDYDTVGRFKYHSDEEEIALLRHGLEAGYGDRILLALDTTAQRLTAYGGALGLDYLLNSFLPRLRREGAPEEAVDGFCRANCRRLFAG